MPITRNDVIAAAFDVMHESGLDGLNLRSVSARLNVKAPALYWHVRSKAELLGLMAASFYREGTEAKVSAQSWQDRLLAYSRAFRRALLSVPDAARLCAIAPPLEDVDATARRLADPLVAAGLNRSEALSNQAAVVAYTLGWVIYEQSSVMHDHVANMIDFEDSFERGLMALVEGFSLREGRGHSSPSYIARS